MVILEPQDIKENEVTMVLTGLRAIEEMMVQVA